MQPIGEAGLVPIAIYRNSRFSQRLEFFVGDTDDAYSLAGMGPFLAEVRDGAENLVCTIDVDDSEAADGALNISIELAPLVSLTVPTIHRWGLMSANGEYLLEGPATARKTAPHFT